MIAKESIRYIVIPEELRAEIAERFFKKHERLIPRHQRDVNRLLALIKAHALLNLWNRERAGEFQENIIVSNEDVEAGFELYEGISKANEMGLPPEIYNIFINLEPKIPDEGVTRKEFQALYYNVFHRTIGKKRLNEVLNLLESVGLITEEPDPEDRRRKKIVVTGRGVFISEEKKPSENGQKTLENIEKINTPEGVTTPIKNEKKVVTPQRVFISDVSTELDDSLIARIKQVESLRHSYKGWCDGCCRDHSKKVIIQYKAATFDGSILLLCEDCARTVMKKLKERDQA